MSSAYTVSYEKAAAKELSKIDKPIARRIVNAVNKLSDIPRPPGCRALVGYDGLWRIRVGDYRIVYAIENEELVVLVVRVAHRREAYRVR